MLSYVFDFNLDVIGHSAERYVTKVAQQWPALIEELPGVQGCLFLTNALTLAGKYTYSFRIDLDSVSALAAYDEALKSDDPRWRESRSEWYERRTEVQGRLLRGTGQSHLQDGDGMLYVVLNYQHRGEGGGADGQRYGENFADRLSQELQTFDSVEHAQHFTTVFQPGLGHGGEVWLRITDINALDDIGTVTGRANELVGEQLVASGLYGQLRLVDGALRSGA